MHILVDINNFKTIIPPVEIEKSIQIGVYCGPGAGEEGVGNFIRNFDGYKTIEVTKLTPRDIQNGELSRYNILAFTGGSGSKQSEGLGAKGREMVRAFVKEGGGYLGICAGVYLAATGFDWESLEIVNARQVVKNEWERGRGLWILSLPMKGEKFLGTCRMHSHVATQTG